MNSFFLSLLMAPQATDATGAPASGGLLQMIVPLGLVIVIFYFLIIRPQNKKQKETQNMLNSMKKGDKIVTIGGIHGIIQSVDEGTVIVKVDENAKIKFLKSAIATVKADDKKADKEDSAEKSAQEDSKE
jgi:preprotein translocase subunit YajC